MMRLLMIVPVLAGSLAVSAAAQPASEQDARQAAQKLADASVNAQLRKDAAGLAALFTEDAVQVTPQGLNSGRAAIEKFEAAALKDYTPDPGKIDWLMPGKGVMLVAGRWSGTYHGPSGPVHLTGYWSWATVREGNAWKIRMETFNSTPPPAESK